MSYLEQAQDAYRRLQAGQEVAAGDQTSGATQCEKSELSEKSPVVPAALPPVHAADDPWRKPATPCMVCGQVRWRVWSDNGGVSWQWICNGCRPLVVRNHDGTEWWA